MKMIRKQFYIEAAQDAKLKRLAASQHRTESEVLREAIQALAEAEEPAWLRRLRAAGLVVEPECPPVSDKELARLDEEWEAIAAAVGDIRLSDAVIEDREERDAFLAGHLGGGETIRQGERLNRRRKPARSA